MPEILSAARFQTLNLAENVYRDKRVVQLTASTVNLISSRFSHGSSGPCKRFGGISCEDHKRVEVSIRKGIPVSLGDEPILYIERPAGMSAPQQRRDLDLLKRWRATAREDEDLFQALLASVSGIAQGLQTTG